MNADRNSIRNQVVSIIAEQVNRPASDIKDTDTLDQLGADSLDRVEIVMKLEEHFGSEISDEEAEKIHTINDILDYIQRSKA